jgi:hypothetical protein
MLIAFTLFHVLISLVGIGSGFVVVFALIASKPLDRWTTLFLWTTVGTSVTGFLFPFHKLLPSHIVGIVSLLILTLAIVALYARHLVGPWRWIFVVNAVLAQYLNFFVLIAQLFQKVPRLKALAAQSPTPFIVTQVVVMALFVVLGYLAVKRFHPGAAGLARRSAALVPGWR